jgi:hypothetical protein
MYMYTCKLQCGHSIKFQYHGILQKQINTVCNVLKHEVYAWLSDSIFFLNKEALESYGPNEPPCRSHGAYAGRDKVEGQRQSLSMHDYALYMYNSLGAWIRWIWVHELSKNGLILA